MNILIRKLNFSSTHTQTHTQNIYRHIWTKVPEIFSVPGWLGLE